MSGFGPVVAFLTAVPMAYGATLRAHERWWARWKLRNYAPLEGDAREGDRVFASGVVHPLDETLVGGHPQFGPHPSGGFHARTLLGQRALPRVIPVPGGGPRSRRHEPAPEVIRSGSGSRACRVARIRAGQPWRSPSSPGDPAARARRIR